MTPADVDAGGFTIGTRHNIAAWLKRRNERRDMKKFAERVGYGAGIGALVLMLAGTVSIVLAGMVWVINKIIESM